MESQWGVTPASQIRTFRADWATSAATTKLQMKRACRNNIIEALLGFINHIQSSHIDPTMIPFIFTNTINNSVRVSTPSAKDLDDLECYPETPRAPLHRIANIRLLTSKLGAADTPKSSVIRAVDKTLTAKARGNAQKASVRIIAFKETVASFKRIAATIMLMTLSTFETRDSGVNFTFDQGSREISRCLHSFIFCDPITKGIQ